MNRSRGALVALLGAVAGGALIPQLHADENAVRRELEAQYARWARAHTARDISALQRFMEEETTPDFIFKGPRRTHTRKQELETYRPVREGKEPWAPAREYRTTVDRLTVRGSEALAVVTDRAVSIVQDPKITGDPTGKRHVLTMERTNRDTWIKTAAGWKLQKRAVLTGKQSLDRKPLSRGGSVPRG
jgi:hypothetical protein